MSKLELDTPHGPARAHLHPAKGARGALLLGHGAGGSVGAPDLVAATEAAVAEGFTVALVEQPYRVAGKKSSPVPGKLDEAWIAVAEQLRSDELKGLPVVSGGRSAGARVACRTAAQIDAVAVICLAFPVHPPGKPEKSRMDELDGVSVPALVVQGESDPFGMPEKAPNRDVVTVAGNHGLKKDLPAVAEAVQRWLSSALG